MAVKFSVQIKNVKKQNDNMYFTHIFQYDKKNPSFVRILFQVKLWKMLTERGICRFGL